MNLKTEKILFYSFLFIAFITVIWIDISANVTFDSGDGLQHYLIARYSWEHPKLLLDLWGKPFFTLISSPFAQFGLKGMFIFQALCALAVSFFSYRIAQKINLKYAWTIPAFIFFSPIYFAVINTGLTEILFGCMFMLSVWLIFEKRFILSAIISSFIPFVRPEAYVVLPLIALVLLFRKKYFVIPFLLFATILYTLIGYFYYDDIFWIITNNYKIIGENYEGMKGSFFHFINHYDEIWGDVYSLLLVVGICTVLYSIIQVLYKKIKYDFLSEEIFLILGSFLACLLLHSLLYSMPGILNNLGMMRYMSVLIPVSAILALKGLNIISVSPLKKFIYLEFLIICILIFFIIKAPFKQWYYPLHLNNEQVVINEVGNWVHSSRIKNKKICYMHPYLAIVADIDPFDEKKVTLLWSLKKEQLNLLPDSTFIIWDSHFAPQEGELPLNLLSDDKIFIPIKHYKYYNESMPFETWLFMKYNSNYRSNLSIIPEIVMDFGLLSNLQKTDSMFFDFDITVPNDKAMLSGEIFFSGKRSLEYTPDKEFGNVFSKKISEIKKSEMLRMIQINFKFFPCDSIKDVVSVIEIKNEDKIVSWYGKSIGQRIIFNEWNSCELQQILFPCETNEKYILNFYFWNKGKRKFYIDNLNIYYYDLKCKNTFSNN